MLVLYNKDKNACNNSQLFGEWSPYKKLYFRVLVLFASLLPDLRSLSLPFLSLCCYSLEDQTGQWTLLTMMT